MILAMPTMRTSCKHEGSRFEIMRLTSVLCSANWREEGSLSIKKASAVETTAVTCRDRDSAAMIRESRPTSPLQFCLSLCLTIMMLSRRIRVASTELAR